MTKSLGKGALMTTDIGTICNDSFKPPKTSYKALGSAAATKNLNEAPCRYRIYCITLCAFITTQPPILRDKLRSMVMASSLTSWITDYLTARPQFVSLGNCVSGTLACSTRAPLGTALALSLFTLCTSDFKSPATFGSIEVIQLLWHVCEVDRRGSIGTCWRPSTGAIRTASS